MHELALFAGAGGGILGGKLLGWTTVCACELDPYARGVLLARQDDGSLPPFPVWDDIRTLDGKPWRGVVDIITGGFPCQDISVAGTGKGLDGERSGLWSEMARIIREVGPRFVLVENSPALTVRGLGIVLGDLAAMGYDAAWGVLGAVHAGAPHKRERIWIVANARRGRCCEPRAREVEQPGRTETERAGNASPDANGYALRQQPERERWGSGAPVAGCDGLEKSLAYADSLRELQPQGCECAERGRACDCGAAVADADRAGRQEQWSALANGAEYEAAECGGWWAAEPDVGRMAHGVAARVDRLRCLGNGQVPSVVRLAWRLLSPFANPGHPMKESNTASEPTRRTDA